MNELIIVKPEKCTGCNSCIRSCPAPEANIVRQLDNGKFIIAVNPDKCIACGECVRTCIHGARDFIDDTEEGMSHLIKEKLILIASPAVKAAPKKEEGIDGAVLAVILAAVAEKCGPNARVTSIQKSN